MGVHIARFGQILGGVQKKESVSFGTNQSGVPVLSIMQLNRMLRLWADWEDSDLLTATSSMNLQRRNGFSTYITNSYLPTVYLLFM